LLTSPAQLAGYESDALGCERFRPALVAIRASADEPIERVCVLQDDAMPFTLREATADPWEFAPRGRGCCGSGGVKKRRPSTNCPRIFR